MFMFQNHKQSNPPEDRLDCAISCLERVISSWLSVVECNESWHVVKSPLFHGCPVLLIEVFGVKGK